MTGRERDRKDPTFHIHPTSEVQPARCSSTALDSPGLCDGIRTEVRTRDTLPVSWLPSPQQPHIIVPQYAECPSSCQVDLSLQAGPKRSIFLQELLASSPATATAEAGTNWCMIDIARQYLMPQPILLRRSHPTKLQSYRPLITLSVCPRRIPSHRANPLLVCCAWLRRLHSALHSANAISATYEQPKRTAMRCSAAQISILRPYSSVFF